MRSRVLATVRRALVPVLATVLLGGAVAATTATPAHAAVPDRWGFGYSDTLIPFNAPLQEQWGSWMPGPVATVNTIGFGRYRVTFPLTAARGVAHVTAISDAPRWCQVRQSYPSGPDQIVDVHCYRHGGAPDWSRFSVTFSSSSGPMAPVWGAYAYVYADPGSAVIHSYNSAGAANTVTHLNTGRYLVRLPAIGTGLFDGNLQATAEHPIDPRRCKIERWAPSGAGYEVYVLCVDQANAPVDTWFHLSYHRERAVFGALGPPKHFAYLWSPDLAGPSNYNSVGAANTVFASGVGQYLVRFDQVGVRETHVQVTAFGSSPDYCGLQEVWQVVGNDVYVRNVICFDGTGQRADNRYFVTYSSRT